VESRRLLCDIFPVRLEVFGLILAFSGMYVRPTFCPLVLFGQLRAGERLLILEDYETSFYGIKYTVYLRHAFQGRGVMFYIPDNTLGIDKESGGAAHDIIFFADLSRLIEENG